MRNEPVCGPSTEAHGCPSCGAALEAITTYASDTGKTTATTLLLCPRCGHAEAQTTALPAFYWGAKRI